MFRVSYRSPLSKQAELPNNADNLSIAVYTPTCARSHTHTYHFLASLILSKKRVTRESRNQTNHPRQTAGVHLLRSPCYLLRKTRGSEISSPFTAIPLSIAFSLLCLHPLFRVQLVSTTRSAELPQTGTMSRYCDPLQAAESCISSSMFPLPVLLPIFLTLPVPLSVVVVSTAHPLCWCPASVPMSVLALRRVAQCICAYCTLSAYRRDYWLLVLLYRVASK